MNTTRVLKTAEEAAAILEYFNGFHDGFIKRLTLNSYDYFERWGVQACSGRLDLEVVIAHYNYRDGEPAGGPKLVHARFTHVRNLQADMPGKAAEWTIMNVHFEPWRSYFGSGRRTVLLRAVATEPPPRRPVGSPSGARLHFPGSRIPRAKSVTDGLPRPVSRRSGSSCGGAILRGA